MMTEILRRAFGGGTFTASEAAAALGIRGPSSTLYRLKSAGVLERAGRGTYRFAPLDRWQGIDTRLALEGIRTTRRDRSKTTADLAAKRFQAWLATGYLVRTAARKYTVNLRTGPKGGLRVRRK